jgi:hypothetical protein
MSNASWIRHMIGFAAVALVSFVMAFIIARAFAKPGEFILRTTGGLLQLFGVLSVAIGIRKLRRSFGLRPVSQEILSELWAWIVQFVRRIARLFGRRGRIVAATATTLGELKLSSSLSTRVIFGRGTNLSVEERLQRLERGFDYMQDFTDKLQDDVQKKIELHTAALAAERADREKYIAQISLQVNELAVGGIQLQIVGMLWLLFGLALATWSQEIAHSF